MTETGLSLGTPHYMSPEQATAEKEITARSDIYSIGSVLYEMLTGHPPHVGATAQQIIMKIITTPAEPVTVHRKSVPPNVAAAIAKSLEKLPADRFETAKAFADALGNPMFATAGATGFYPGGAGGSGGVSKRAFAATATLAVAATAGLAWSLTRPTPPREVSRFSVLLPDSQALGASNTTQRAAVSPDGRIIVYMGGVPGSSDTRLWVRRLDELRAAPLPGTDGASNPTFSPDGKKIAFESGARRTIKWMALAGGAITPVTDSLVDRGGLTWSSDGYLYYDGHFDGDGVARVRASGGKPEIVTRADSAANELYHYHPRALPGGRGLLFTIARPGGAGDFDVAAFDAKTGKYHVLARGVDARYAESGHLLWVNASGHLLAAPFDLARLALTGEPVTVTSGVAVRGNNTVDLDISSTGLLTYTAGSAEAGRREVVWVGRDGAATPIDTGWVADFAFPIRLSPDGRQLVAAIRGAGGVPDVWVKQLDHGPAQKIAINSAYPAWSPDGRTVAFASPLGGIRTVAADGSSLAKSLHGGSLASWLRYTRDGKWIVYAERGDLFAVRTDGDTARRTLVASSAIEASPVVSPDGRWLAYHGDEQGRPEVFVVPFPETATMKRQVSTAGGRHPRWSSDGRELFFVDAKEDLIAVPVLPGLVFKTEVPRRLFSVARYLQGNEYDVSPDGRRFIFVRPAGNATVRPDELSVVQNFFEELKAKVPGKK